MTSQSNDSHSKMIGYIVWIFGMFGAHRFYYGKKVSGTIYFLTGGLCLVGWLVDFFLIPSMEDEADSRYQEGRISYTTAWILMTYGWMFGVHHFYMGKWVLGIVYALSGGLLGIGYLYDLWTLNEQIDQVNRAV